LKYGQCDVNLVATEPAVVKLYLNERLRDLLACQTT